MIENAVSVGEFKVVTGSFKDIDSAELKKMADSVKADCENSVAVFAGISKDKVTFCVGCSKAAVNAGANAGLIVREIAKIAGGNGGGKPDLAMAGGKDASMAQAALDKAAEIISGFIEVKS